MSMDFNQRLRRTGMDDHPESFPPMSDADFARFKDLIYEKCGIHLTSVKKTMLSSRLRKRMRLLRIMSFAQYYRHISAGIGDSEELVHMIDSVSTNKTEFFRESKHFNFLHNEALPLLVESGIWKSGQKLNIWSAGCSTGEEPYTLAMVTSYFIEKVRPLDFSILASDISTRVLEIGGKGVYPESAVVPVPKPMRLKYLMKGTGSQKGNFRIVPELRNKLRFQRINLNEGNDFSIKTRMEIIFCRNVIIYFDRDTQKRLFEKFYQQLAPGGYLFIGHSETLNGLNSEFNLVAGSTYRKPE